MVEVTDDLAALGRRLAAEFPVASQHRGWTVRNLVHNFERTPYGVEETWSCDIAGPRDLYSERRQFQGGKLAFTWRIVSDVIGTAESSTPEGLVNQVKAIVDALGIRDLKEPD